MYKFSDCQNKFCPFDNIRDATPCSCGGTGIVMSGKSTVPLNDPRVTFSPAFRARHRLPGWRDVIKGLRDTPLTE